MATYDLPKPLSNDLSNAIKILECFNQYILEAKSESKAGKDIFNYQEIYYNLRYHILGFNDLLNSAKSNIRGLGESIQEISQLQNNKVIFKTIDTNTIIAKVNAGNTESIRRSLLEIDNDNTSGNDTDNTSKTYTDDSSETVTEQNFRRYYRSNLKIDTCDQTPQMKVERAISSSINNSKDISKVIDENKIGSLSIFENKLKTDTGNTIKTIISNKLHTSDEVKQLFIQLFQKKTVLEDYIRNNCYHYFNQESEIVVPWEGNIIFTQKNTSMSEKIRKQIEFLKSDIRLARNIITCLNSQTKQDLDDQFENKTGEFAFSACKSTLNALIKCKDNLVTLIQNKEQTLSSSEFDELCLLLQTQRKELEEAFKGFLKL